MKWLLMVPIQSLEVSDCPLFGVVETTLDTGKPTT
ncbi:MAG: hypothetical protein ACI8VE_002975, partial [Natrialbaceae archaeon]